MGDFNTGHITAAWANRRLSWDFANKGPLFLPVPQFTNLVQAMIEDKPRPVPMVPRIVYQLENGTFDGRPAKRIVGQIEGTKIKAIVEITIDGVMVDPSDPRYAAAL